MVPSSYSRCSFGGRARGSVIIYVVVMMTALLGFTSLAIDYARVQMVKTQLLRAADAAARAAASQLGSDVTATQNAAVTWGGYNTADGSSVVIDSTNDVDFGTWNTSTRTFTVLSGAARSGANAVRVTARRTAGRGTGVSLWFAQLIGRTTCDVNSSAIACAASGNYGMVGLGSINISGGTVTTDSYDASAGSYSAGSAGSLGSLASNGGINLNGTLTINSKLYMQSGQSISANGSVSYGSRVNVGSTITWPTPSAGSYSTTNSNYLLGLPANGTNANYSNGSVTFPAGTYYLNSVNLRTFFTRPARFLAALKLAMRCSRRADRGLPLHLIYLAEACVLLRWFDEAKIEHVHAHFGTNSTTVAMLCRALGGPAYSFTCHGPEEFDKPEFLKLGEKIARAAFVVAVSEFGRSQLYRWCGHAHWSKIHVVHCGVDAGFLNDPGAPANTSAKLVCIGRLAEQKGQLLLVQAAALLSEAGEAFELVLVGDGVMRGEIEKLIETHRLEGKVRIAGWMSNDQVREQLLQSRAMVLPSFAEGLPVVCMEALALHRPVISTFVAGIPELVEPGVCGWLVPAGAVQPLADAMRAALHATGERLQEMGRAGAERVALQHDAMLESKKLLSLLNFSVCQSPSAPRNAATLPAPQPAA